MGKLEIRANVYPELSKFEEKGIQIQTVDSKWRIFIFPEGWKLKHVEKCKEKIIDSEGNLFGFYTVIYRFWGEEKKIQIC